MAEEPAPYRLDVRLPRELSSKLEKLQKDVADETGKKTSKSELVVHILERFFASMHDGEDVKDA